MSTIAAVRRALAFAFAARQPQRPFPALPYGHLPFSTSADQGGRKRVVFLGTPQISALVLQELLQASAAPGSNFEVAAVVSRPSSRQWREQAAGAAACTGPAPLSGATTAAGSARPPSQPPNWARHSESPVEKLACSIGLPPERILCPVSAKEPEFLDVLRRLQPHLAVTAAYGGMLPQAFLDIPRYGTINIHPSLLPKYRGPAPVRRALQDGCSVSGVSLVFTVLKCDAGPVLEQQQVRIDPDIQAPELTEQMFRLGAQMLLRQLPGLLSGAVTVSDAAVQDDEASSYAPKVDKREGMLDFRLSAQQCHDHVRAMAGGPGSRATLLAENRTTGALEPIEVRVLCTRMVAVAAQSPDPATRFTDMLRATDGTGAASAISYPPQPPGQLPPGTRAPVLYTGGELLVPCGDGNLMSVLKVARRRGGNTGGSASSTSRTFLTAKEFIDSLGKRRLFVPA